jgi:hypothetical protein
MWEDFTQEEIQEGYHSSDQKEDKTKENVSLAAKRKNK